MLRIKLKRYLSQLAHPVFAIGISLVLGAIAIRIVGANPLEIYGIMLNGAFGNKYYILATLTRATPIIICGLGAAIAWSTRYMGIGGEGQMIVGGFVTSIFALYMPGPEWLILLAAILGSIAAGGVYSVFSGWLLRKFKMSLAITTLMLNYVALFVTYHFVANRFLDTTTTEGKLEQTKQISASLRFPQLFEGYPLHLGFIIAVILVFLLWFVMNKTTFGYEAKMSGFNRSFSDFGGINSKKIMYSVLFISGAICALAGTGEVLGTQYRYVHNMYVSASFAWIGLNAALISNYNPLGILVSSIILAGIQTGGSAIARSTSVPLEISAIIQGCITLFISAKIIISWKRNKKELKKEQIMNDETIEQNKLLNTGTTQDVLKRDTEELEDEVGA